MNHYNNNNSNTGTDNSKLYVYLNEYSVDP